MTVGQRIAQKRKELGLSQEALGERLGVSRQAIYKWESDAALPEIEKLVNLSREFSVSIDWLLGEGDESKELTPEQLRMVEEIVGRYLAVQPKPEPVTQEIDPEAESETGPAGVRWLKRWGLAWAGLAVLMAIVIVFFSLFDRLDSVRQENQNLQMTMTSVRYELNNQINRITNQIEDILQSQNALTVEQSAEIVSTDYRANTITVSARAVPRTWVDGMTAEFVLTSGGETVAVPGELGDGHAFTAEVTGPLSDDIAASVVFITGEQRQTQLLNQYSDLYRYSLPNVFVSCTHNTKGDFIYPKGDGGKIPWFAAPEVDVIEVAEDGRPEVVSLRLGLFRDQKLVAWYEYSRKLDRSEYSGGGMADYYKNVYRFTLEDEVALEEGVPYCWAVLVTDEYGRTWMCTEGTCTWEGQMTSSDHYHWGEYSSDPADWDY